MNISFFAKPANFVKRSHLGGGHLFRGSSLIRGEQISEYLEAKFNPTEGYENDMCIYVKPENLDDIQDDDYVDIVDSKHLIKELQNRPKIRVIASSLCSYEYLKGKLKNAVILIPQHHCNFERELRERKDVFTVGAIGVKSGFQYSIEEIIQKLGELGIPFLTKFDYSTRQDVVDFYKTINIQIGWSVQNKPMKNPLKIINAASFGIPTVAHQQIGYKEFEGNYIPVDTINALIEELKKLKNENYYNEWATKIIKPTEEYHIENVAKLYRQLIERR